MGEDIPVTNALRRSQRVVHIDHPELYVYIAHSANTWDAEHMEGIWRKASRQFEKEAYAAALAQFSRCYPIDDCLRVLHATNNGREPRLRSSRRRP